MFIGCERPTASETLHVYPDNIAVGKDGKEVFITIESSYAWEISIPDDCSWIKCRQNSNAASGRFKVLLDIDETLSSDIRSTTIMVKNAYTSSYITVTQDSDPMAGYCIKYRADEKINRSFSQSDFGSTILSHTWSNGVGVIKCADPITKIGVNAFSYSDITDIMLPETITVIGYCAFFFCEDLTNITIPSSVMSIGESAFNNCDNLTSVTIRNGVKSIGEEAFSDCQSLTHITIPDSVTSIGDSAFDGCEALKSVYIGEGVRQIDAFAFSSGQGLIHIYCRATTPPSIGIGAFGGYSPARRIYVPRNSVEAYKRAKNMEDEARKIVGYDFE